MTIKMPGYFSRFVKLRTKIALGVTITFGVLFGSSYTLYYHFISARVVDNIREHLIDTAEGTAAGIDVEAMLSLYREGERNSEGFSNDLRYQMQLEWFRTIRQLDPIVYPYSYAIGPVENSRRIGETAVQPGKIEIVYLVDSLLIDEPDNGLRFLEPDSPSEFSLQAYHSGETTHRPLYSDEWGSWMSAYVPLKDNDGTVVGILGVDIKADYVARIRRELLKSALFSFFPTYGLTICLVYIFSGRVTRKITSLTHLSEKVADGNYQSSSELSDTGLFPDEINVLAKMLKLMTDAIQDREQRIRKYERTDAEIRYQLAQERELNSLRSRTISTISHELRTPITIIKMASKLLQTRKQELATEKVDSYIERVCLASTRMGEIIDEMLLIESADAEALELELTRVNLKQLCRELLEEVRSFDSKQHNIQLSVHQCGRDLWLDKRLLHHILINLLSNAIKYSPAGSTVYFRVDCSQDMAVFEVKDEGIGIPKEEQPYLFDRFFRANNVDPSGGTGLGLSIAQRCVDLHKGSLHFTSQLNVGSKFTVQIPLSDCEPQSCSLESSSASGVASNSERA
ncbi:HAMP domain-containing sensor histidine kinase [Synechococcus sp. PCC 7336]|uniref:sensor histidine kinase n=1 Tax=Synechococcus sp. PCC 7336 TaxID=195250 RepID=UPI000683F275|nr:HAMP domain-containing sensor histidine kinase [Synechococcus sp. PCC 7336]